MPDLNAAHARDLGDYASLARRRWAWIAAAALVGLAVALGYLATAQQTYVSMAKVQVMATTSTGDAVGARTNDEINLDTEAQLVTSQPVATRAGEMLESTLTPVALARRVSISVPPNTTVMAISFSAPSAEGARQGAEAFARAYLESRQETAQAVLQTDVDRLERLIDETQEEVLDTNVRISRLEGPNEKSDRAFMIARRSTLSTQLATYNAELAPLVDTEVVAGKVILDAQLPTSPVDPDPMVLLPAGLMAGLVLGLGLAAWRERSDRRIHTGAELERLFGLVPLASLVARGRGRFVRIDHDVRAFYHSLRANGPESGEVVALVGPDTSDTAEHLSWSIAMLAARSGSPTAYITRPRSPVIELRRRAQPEVHELLDLSDYESLQVLVDGEFRSSVLRAELTGLAASHDLLILGLPHDDPSVDLPILGRHLDVAVVVVRLGVTRRDTVATVLADLTKSGVDRVFAVTIDLGRSGPGRTRASADEVFAGAATMQGRSAPIVVDGVVDEPQVKGSDGGDVSDGSDEPEDGNGASGTKGADGIAGNRDTSRDTRGTNGAKGAKGTRPGSQAGADSRPAVTGVKR
jgi:capsular polysaccharide biosynthesis protein